MFGNDERFALLIWTKQDVMSLTQAMTEVEADAILREIGRKGMANIPETVFQTARYRRCTPDYGLKSRPSVFPPTCWQG